MASAAIVVFMIVSVEFDAEPGDLVKVPSGRLRGDAAQRSGTRGLSLGW